MSDSPEPSPEILREFLDAEKALPDPSPDVQQRVFARLSTTLGLAGGAGDAPAPTTANAPLAPPPATGNSLGHILAHGSGRGLATFLVGAAVGATIYGTVAHLRQPSRTAETPPAAVAPRAPEPAPAEPKPTPEAKPADEPAPRPLLAAPGNGRGAFTPAAGGSRDAGLAAERKWVEMARTALARSRVDSALASLRHHARQYPNGQLAEERDSLLVQALVAKGDFAQARARATQFDRQHPHSLFSPAIEQALQSIP